MHWLNEDHVMPYTNIQFEMRRKNKHICSILNEIQNDLSFLHMNNWYYIDGLVQEKGNSIANALELLLSGTKPSIWVWYWFHIICAATNPHAMITQHDMRLRNTGEIWHIFCFILQDDDSELHYITILQLMNKNKTSDESDNGLSDGFYFVNTHDHY